MINMAKVTITGVSSTYGGSSTKLYPMIASRATSAIEKAKLNLYKFVLATGVVASNDSDETTDTIGFIISAGVYGNEVVKDGEPMVVARHAVGHIDTVLPVGTKLYLGLDGYVDTEVTGNAPLVARVIPENNGKPANITANSSRIEIFVR